jgi:hypothetical protein
VLELAGTRLSQLTGKEWRVQDGPLLKGPGSVGVRIGPRHDDSFRHIDLEFLLNVDREETSLPDCSTGTASDPEEATRQAIAAWADTTASVALEILTQNGKYAEWLQPGTPEGYPGWQAIIGKVSTWGFGEDASAKGDWIAEKHPWVELATVISPALDRPFLNGVRLFVGQGGDFTSCEIRINGVLHEPSSAALTVMDWPRTEKMSTARAFLLLIHPEEAEH